MVFLLFPIPSTPLCIPLQVTAFISSRGIPATTLDTFLVQILQDTGRCLRTFDIHLLLPRPAQPRGPTPVAISWSPRINYISQREQGQMNTYRSLASRKGANGSRPRDVALANEKTGIWTLKKGWFHLLPTSIFSVRVSSFRARVARITRNCGLRFNYITQARRHDVSLTAASYCRSMRSLTTRWALALGVRDTCCLRCCVTHCPLQTRSCASA